ncbi:MAG: hypothetical protein JXN61_16730 [Sedimentisphaerales bacterium]|nr:hypothetical protein [Sedimentisphaerales bacterium]
MSPLGIDEKQLLFDYSFGLTSQIQSAQAEALISSSSEAAETYGRLRALLAPLDSVDLPSCPDELVERTIARITGAANSGHLGLEELLADEQERPVTGKIGFWRNLGEMVAVAAAVMLVAGVLLPVFNRARQDYWKQRCQAQLSSIFGGLSNYVEDHDGRPPAVAAKPGQQWNTQCLYLPFKLGYIKDSALFICPGRDSSRAAQFDISRVAECDDFPSRQYVTYSPRKRCANSPNAHGLCEGPMLSDRNPIFDDGAAVTFKKRLDQAIMRANSKNHRGKGQNVLYHDGSVKFITIRLVAEDDIFALTEGMDCGDEVDDCEMLPAHEADVFLAP